MNTRHRVLFRPGAPGAPEFFVRDTKTGHELCACISLHCAARIAQALEFELSFYREQQHLRVANALLNEEYLHELT